MEEMLALAHCVALKELLVVEEGQREEEGVTDALAQGVGCGLALEEALAVAETVVEDEREALMLGVADREAIPDGVSEADSVGLQDCVRLLLLQLEVLPLGLGLPDAQALPERVTDGQEDGERVPGALPEVVIEPLGEAVVEREVLGDCEGECVGLGVPVTVTDPEPHAVRVNMPVMEALTVADTVTDA